MISIPSSRLAINSQPVPVLRNAVGSHPRAASRTSLDLSRTFGSPQIARISPFLLRRFHASYVSSSFSLSLLLVLLLPLLLQFPLAEASYSNVTLTSLNGDLSVVVYLPVGIKPTEATYYESTRFDHSSMIGSIHRKIRRLDATTGQEQITMHRLFENDMWRIPHNSQWPESGVGLAAEFGVGDDGDFCFYRCGWTQANDVTNGVLGYRDAKLGESFLKIGVGELLKGTCPSCDITEDYKFNSPYMFAKTPKWTMTQESLDQLGETTSLRLEHEATLREYGYKIEKEVTLADNVLSVSTTFTNLGRDAFYTAWYAHNFFTCDGNAVGPGYSIDLDLIGTNRDKLYDEPGTWSWSTPLAEYATVKGEQTYIGIEMFQALNPGIRIKSEFVNDGQTKGSYRLEACDTVINSSLDVQDLTMYAYNLYVERGTFSPEPLILMHFIPGEPVTWTQRLVIEDQPNMNPALRLGELTTFRLRAVASMNDLASYVPTSIGGSLILFATLLMLLATVYAIPMARAQKRWFRRRQYLFVHDVDAGTASRDSPEENNPFGDDDDDNANDNEQCSLRKA